MRKAPSVTTTPTLIQTLSRRTRRPVGALVAILLAAVAAGCGADGSSNTSGDGPTAAGKFPRTIQHAMGQTTIKQRPTRIVALDRTFTDAALALNANVVGHTTFTPDDSTLPRYLRRAGGKNAEGAKVVGLLTEPDLEKIVKLHPDVILSAKVRHEAIYDKLSKIAPTVFSQTTPTWKQNLELVGRVLGKQRQAKAEIEDFEQRAREVGDNIRAKLGHNPTVTLVRFAGEPTVRLYTRDSFPGGIVYDDVGLARPKSAPSSKDIAVNLSEERIADLDAQHIFVATYQGGQTDKPANVRTQFQRNPLWKRLSGQTHSIDDTIWFSSVGLLGATKMLNELAHTFGVDPAKDAG